MVVIFFVSPLADPQMVLHRNQREGFTVACDWLGTDVDGHGIRYCWLIGREPGEIAVPAGWSLESSLSESSVFVGNDELDERVEFIRMDGPIYVYRDKTTGEELFRR